MSKKDSANGGRGAEFSLGTRQPAKITERSLGPRQPDAGVGPRQPQTPAAPLPPEKKK